MTCFKSCHTGHRVGSVRKRDLATSLLRLRVMELWKFGAILPVSPRLRINTGRGRAIWPRVGKRPKRDLLQRTWSMRWHHPNRLPTVASMPAQRLRRWAGIERTVGSLSFAMSIGPSIHFKPGRTCMRNYNRSELPACRPSPWVPTHKYY